MFTVSSTSSPPGRSARCASTQRRLQDGRRQVLGDLRREHAAQARGPACPQEVEQRDLLDREVAPTALAGGLRVRLGPDAVDTRLAQELEELAAAAAEVGHGRRVAKELDVGRKALADRVAAAAEAVLERDVGRVVRGAHGGGRHGRRRGRRTQRALDRAHGLGDRLHAVAQRQQALQAPRERFLPAVERLQYRAPSARPRGPRPRGPARPSAAARAAGTARARSPAASARRTRARSRRAGRSGSRTTVEFHSCWRASAGADRGPDRALVASAQAVRGRRRDRLATARSAARRAPADRAAAPPAAGTRRPGGRSRRKQLRVRPLLVLDADVERLEVGVVFHYRPITPRAATRPKRTACAACGRRGTRRARPRRRPSSRAPCAPGRSPARSPCS